MISKNLFREYIFQIIKTKFSSDRLQNYQFNTETAAIEIKSKFEAGRYYLIEFFDNTIFVSQLEEENRDIPFDLSSFNYCFKENEIEEFHRFISDIL